MTPREAISAGDWSDTVLVQAMTFAVQWGLTAAWRALGVRPGAIIGHSVGEIAASVVAGVLDPVQAARLACRRAQLLRQVTGRGQMIMVNLSFADARWRIRGHTGLAAAVEASSSWTVLSGDRTDVEDMAGALRAEGIIVRDVASDVAFHSPHMNPLGEELRTAVADFRVSEPVLPLYSTALADPRSTELRTADYWAQNLRNPVRFTTAVEAAIADGHTLFLEVSAHPIVTHSINELLEDRGIDYGFAAYTLRRNVPEERSLLTNFADLFCHGATVDFSAIHPAEDIAPLPTMAWQHRPYWLPASGVPSSGQGHDPGSHTLLGKRTLVNGAEPVHLWQTQLDFDSRPYGGEHRMFNVEIVPAAVLITTLLATEVPGHEVCGLRDVDMRYPITLTSPRELQIVAHNDSARICARRAGEHGDDTAPEEGWVTHVTASLMRGEPAPPSLEIDPEAIRSRTVRCPWQEALATYEKMGVGGFGFAWPVEGIYRSDGELLAEVVCPAQNGRPETGADWATALDAASTLAALLLPDDGVIRMIAHLDSVVLGDLDGERVLIYARRALDSGAGDIPSIHVVIADPTGVALGVVRGLRFVEAAGQPDAGEASADDENAEASATIQRWKGLPEDELLQRVTAGVCQQVADELKMPPEEVTPGRSLSDMGADSLMTVRLRNRLNRYFGVVLPSTLLWEQPTLRTVARALVAELAGPADTGQPSGRSPWGASRPSGMTAAEMEREAGLDLPAASATGKTAQSAPAVLLTGATGYVGAFLLAEVLRGHRGPVRCLVRARDLSHALTRLRENAAAYGVEVDWSRVVPVMGDLDKPQLGLDEAGFTELGTSVGVIYHCGAKVNWNYPYSVLRATNVLGTKEILRLAFTHGRMPVHFISTVGVFLSADFAGDRVTETEDLDSAGTLLMGYSQSKWISERLVRKAHAHGLPMTIHRINTGPDSAGGRYNSSDYLSLVLKECARSGVAPQELPMPPQPAPVDFVARAIVELANHTDTNGGTFHLVNHHPLDWNQVFDNVEAAGYPLTRIPFREWSERVAADQESASALEGLDAFFRNAAGHVRMPVFDNALTRSVLEPLGLSCPEIGDDLMRRFLRQLLPFRS